MRQVREIVRLHQAGVSTREIGIRVGVAASTARLTLRRVAVAGMPGWSAPRHSWNLPGCTSIPSAGPIIATPSRR